MMQELYNNYTKTREEIKKVDDRIARLERKRRSLEEKSSWVTQIVTPLAEKLAEHFGLFYEIYGPFGLGARTSIYLRADMTKSIVEADTWGITLSPSFQDGRPVLYYETGEKTNDYQRGSIGELNGWNNRLAPLPDSVEEIAELMNFSKGHAE